MILAILSTFEFLFLLEKVSSKSWLLAFIISVISAVLLQFFFQNSMVYSPVIPLVAQHSQGNPKGFRHPSEVNLNALNVEVMTEDGVKLRGWLITKKEKKQILIYFHENAGNLGIRMNYLSHLHQQTDSDVLIVAYRGFSDSLGEATEEGLQQDAKAIIAFAVSYVAEAERQGCKKDIFVLGRSMGGAVAIYSSTLVEFKQNISGFIIQNTFASIEDLLFSFFPPSYLFRFFINNKWPSKDRIVDIEQPMLFVRSVRDESVPTQHMQRLFSLASRCQMKREYVIAEGKHNIWWELDPVGYSAAINTFIEDVKYFQSNDS